MLTLIIIIKEGPPRGMSTDDARDRVSLSGTPK